MRRGAGSMAVSKAFIAVIFSMALAGCTSMWKGGGMHTMTQKCITQSCTILVMVTPTADGCTVSLESGGNIVEVQRGNRNVELKWRLVTTGYEFARHGVVFGEVDQIKPKAFSKTEVTWKDDNDKTKKKYAYTVLVVRHSPDQDPNDEYEYTKCTPLDPWIHNQ
jgi:hypothetical protein